MKTGDKVKSHLALWKDCEGIIWAIVKNEDGKVDADWVHVRFPETDRHYGFQQSFYARDLILLEK